MNDLKKELKSQMALKGITFTQVIEEMNNRRSKDNQTTIQNINNKITRGTIKYSDVLEILDILSLKVVWLPKED